MSLTDDNVKQLMTWLDAGATSETRDLCEELAYLLFYGDPTWAGNVEDSSSVSDYRSILESWFANDSADENAFTELTVPEKSPDELVAWFIPVVEKWKEWAKTTEGNVEKGIPNPNFEADQTPGTEFY